VLRSQKTLLNITCYYNQYNYILVVTTSYITGRMQYCRSILMHRPMKLFFIGLMHRPTQPKAWTDGKRLHNIFTDLLNIRCLRNSYFSVTLKNMHQLHISRKKVQLHFSVRKVQLVAVALFLNYSCTFLRWLSNKNFSGNWDIGKPIYLYLTLFSSQNQFWLSV
jgi:hypothetical protein